MKNLEQVAETIGAAKMAEKLAVRIQDDQRQIEFILSDVSAMSWPSNLLGRMEALVEQRDYAQIRDLLDQWMVWLERSEQVQVKMKETAMVIQAFVAFYEQTNGKAPSG